MQFVLGTIGENAGIRPLTWRDHLVLATHVAVSRGYAHCCGLCLSWVRKAVVRVAVRGDELVRLNILKNLYLFYSRNSDVKLVKSL